jgi:hypothetical protein
MVLKEASRQLGYSWEDFVRNDSQARVAFIDKVAPPVANKLFECGLMP